MSINTEAEPGGTLKIAEVQLAAARENFARIVEQCTVESREDLPPIFAIQHKRIVVIEAREAKSTHVILAAQHWLHIERHNLPGILITHQRFRAQGNYTSSIRERNILLRFRSQPPVTEHLP